MTNIIHRMFNVMVPWIIVGFLLWIGGVSGIGWVQAAYGLSGALVMGWIVYVACDEIRPKRTRVSKH